MMGSKGIFHVHTNVKTVGLKKQKHRLIRLLNRGCRRFVPLFLLHFFLYEHFKLLSLVGCLLN